MFRRLAWTLSIATMLDSGAAGACSCAWENFRNGAAQNQLMFKGEVVKVEILSSEASPTLDGTPASMRTTFRVKEVLQGEPIDGQQLYSFNKPYTCAVDFPGKVGQTFTIAAYQRDGKFFTDHCTFLYFNLQGGPPR